ncbi:MAG: DUF11 domain-containing protein, partial [Gammaproteobacteria bacterium]|nr:DUF11 domain-containing protein [Gammaproteobacteria bacterium]
MPETDPRYPFTCEYAVRSISQSSNGDYIYAPDSNELTAIFQNMAAAIIGLGGSASTGTRGTISAGDSLLYKVYYNNTGIGNAGDLWVNDTLPESVSIVDSNASVMWNYINNYYSWHFLDVPPGSHWFWIEVEISNNVVDTQEVLNLIEIEYTDTDGNYVGSDNDTAIITVSEPEISLTKQVSTTIAEPGDYINYTIHYENIGSSMALFVWVNDSFDPNLQYISDSAFVAPVVNGNNYSWKLPGVIPGTNYFNITLQVLEGTPGGIVIDNLITADYANEGNVIHNITSVSNTVSTSISNTQINIEKIVNNEICDPGDALIYSIYFNNTGTDTANTVWINDTLPGMVTYTGDSAQTSPSSSPYFSGRTILGQEINYVFTNVIPGTHMFQITAQVDAGVSDGTFINNSVELDYTDELGYLLPPSTATAMSICGVINITKTGDMNLIPSAGTSVISLTITVKNCHPTEGLNNVNVTDTLSPGVSWAGNVNSVSGLWNWNGALLEWDIPYIPPLETVILSFDVSLTPGGTGTFQLNNGAVVSGTTDTGYLESAISNEVYVDAVDSPILDYSLWPTSCISNSTQTFYMNVTNIGTDGVFYDASGDSVIVTMPFSWGPPTNIVAPVDWTYTWVSITHELTFTYDGGTDYNWISGTTLDFTFDYHISLVQGIEYFSMSGSIHDGAAVKYDTDRIIGVNVGIGEIDHIIVNPDPCSIIAGQPQAFTAIAYDLYNNIVPSVDFLWATDVGVVDESGTLIAQIFTGTGIVTAMNGTIFGTANINIVPGAFDHISITPDPASISAGQTQQFIATAHDSYGNILAGYGFDWTTNIGSIDAAGLFTAPIDLVGGLVTATNGSISYSAEVTIVPWTIHHIEITPDSVTLTVGDTQAFTATAYDVYNHEIPSVDFIWGTSVGSIDASGLLTAQTTPAIGVVIASNGTVNCSASVNVIAGALDYILVSPNPTNVP